MILGLYGNAAALSRTPGGGPHGHIRLIMTPALYATSTATPYMVPIDHGILPQMSHNATDGVSITTAALLWMMPSNDN